MFGGDVDGILQTLSGGFSFDCRDVPAFFSLAGVDLSSEIEAVPTHRLLLDGKIGSGEVIISGGSLTTDSGHIRLDPSRIALPSMSRPITDTAIEAALDIDVPELAQISRLFKIPRLGGGLKGQATVTGTIGAPGGRANIAARGLSFMDMTYGDLTLMAAADSQKAVIESVTLKREKDHFTGHGTFLFAKQELEGVQLDFQLADLSFYVAKLWPDNLKFARGKPRVSGGLTGYFYYLGNEAYREYEAAATPEAILRAENAVKLWDAATWTAIGVGGVSLVASTVLWLSAPSTRELRSELESLDRQIRALGELESEEPGR